MTDRSSLTPEFEVSFTIRSANELARMSRRWYFWPLYVLRNLYSFALLALLVFGGLFIAVKSFLAPTPDPSRAAVGLVMAAGPSLFYWWVYRRNSRKATERLASINPVKLSFTPEGFHTTEKSGATSFAPWSSFKGYRDGKTIFLLLADNQRGFRAIPKEGLTAIQVEQIRSAVKSCLRELV